jgi:cytochrome c-type biogenesis protein CcmH/NrfG
MTQLGSDPTQGQPRPTGPALLQPWARRNLATVSVAALLTIVFAGLLAAGVWLANQRDARKTQIWSAVKNGWWQWGLARGARPGDLRPWDDAVKAARDVQPLTKSRYVDAATRAKVDALVTDIENERFMAAHTAEILKTETRLLDELIALRTLQGGPFDENVDPIPVYARAFRETTHDPERQTTQRVAVWIQSRERGFGGMLTAALEDWSARWRAAGKDGWTKLCETAKSSSPDRQRDALHNALIAGDRTRLTQMCAAADLQQIPVPTALLLARLRSELGDRRGAIEALRIAAQRFPNDLWINFELADALRINDPPDLQGAIRYFTAARAIRAGTAHVLAHVLEAGSRRDEAIAIFRDLAHRKPDVGRHHLCLAATLQAHGQASAARTELEAAVNACRKTLKSLPNDAITHCDLGIALRENGDRAGALAQFREALRIQPEDPRARRLAAAEAPAK